MNEFGRILGRISAETMLKNGLFW